jgi:DNA-binding transcriptional LysR family regulator
MREPGSRTRARIEEAAGARGLTLVPAIEAEGREAVRDLVASGAGVGFVSEAEFGADPRIVPLPLAGPPILMEEALVCLAERAEVRHIRAFMALAGR